MVTIDSRFIADFKLGDNICHNLEIVRVLYDQFEEADASERHLLCKPIIVLLAAVLEAVLYDFHRRVSMLTIAGVRNLTATSLAYIRFARIDDFSKYIDSARKQRLFGKVDRSFYEDMHEIRRLRNRVHIQNEKRHPPLDEAEVFTPDAKRTAERVVERTLRALMARYPQKDDRVADFVLPWPAHFQG